MSALRGATARLSLLLAASALVCLGQAPAPNTAARVVSLSGQVSIQQDNGLWALSVGSTVQMTQLIVTGPDGHAVFEVVSDGSTFEVFPNARVVFRKNTGSTKDLLDVLLGRVRVKIEHMLGIPNPNRVLTPTAVISVRGTTFDITVEDDDEESTLIEVEEGLVDVRHALLPSSNPNADAGIDKGALAKRLYRAAMDLIYTLGSRTPRVSVGGSTGGGSAGDIGKKVPPPVGLPPPH
jgi:hypothetical protein